MSIETLENFSALTQLIDELSTSADSGSVGLLLGELNGLNKINNRFGYLAGDTAIDIFHQKLKAIARPGDRAVRIGGTLFALLVKDPMHEGHALLAAEKVSQLASEWINVSEVRLRLEVNIGVSITPSLADSAEELVKQAEIAQRFCQTVDEQFALWQPKLNEKKGTLTHSLFDAKSAIENGEFRMMYQPKVCLKSNATVGAEALVRWQSPEGLISPQNFLSEIERSRAMAHLLQFVANSAAREVSRWCRYNPDFSISINATTTDIEDSDIIDVLQAVLGMWDIKPDRLILEVTETMLMNDVDTSIDTLAGLRELGIRTSIDDFGTGYSSLAYLRDLPIDEIKIDRSFIKTIDDDAADKHIVRTLIELARAMELSVVAEGIESEAMAVTLAMMGCGIGQGYHFGKPMPAKQFEEECLKQTTAEATNEP